LHTEPRIEDLHPLYQQIARLIGLENAVRLGREFGGENIYFPKIDSHMSPQKKQRDRSIRGEFNGHNYMELAKKYGLTSNQIRKIVKGKASRRSEPPK
jgi:Mor family transcriptional regulator